MVFVRFGSTVHNRRINNIVHHTLFFFFINCHHLSTPILEDNPTEPQKIDRTESPSDHISALRTHIVHHTCRGKSGDHHQRDNEKNC